MWDCALTLDPCHPQGGGLITLRQSWRALTAMMGWEATAAGDAAGDSAPL